MPEDDLKVFFDRGFCRRIFNIPVLASAKGQTDPGDGLLLTSAMSFFTIVAFFRLVVFAF